MAELNATRRELVAHTYAQNTREGYAKDLADFEAWCKLADRQPLPVEAETLALYLTDRLSTCRVSTLERRLTGILFHNRRAGNLRPSTEECRAILAGARRQRKERPQGKAALSVEDLRRISRKLAAMPTRRAVRDRALLVFGFAAAMRRSEIAAANLADISFARQGIALRIPFSKTDQEGEGMVLGVFRGRRPETDPVGTLRAWLRLRGMQSGPLFTHITPGDNVTLARLSDNGIGAIVKAAIRLVKLDPALYSPHSLRAGCVTAACDGGAPDLAIMRRTGHRSLRTTRRYDRSRNPFSGVNPLAKAL